DLITPDRVLGPECGPSEIRRSNNRVALPQRARCGGRLAAFYPSYPRPLLFLLVQQFFPRQNRFFPYHCPTREPFRFRADNATDRRSRNHARSPPVESP